MCVRTNACVCVCVCMCIDKFRSYLDSSRKPKCHMYVTVVPLVFGLL